MTTLRLLFRALLDLAIGEENHRPSGYGRQDLFGLELIFLVIVTAVAVSLRDQHIREQLKADNA